MYLSRIKINLARRGARKLLGSSQVMHATVLASFPQPAGDVGRVLWRIDKDTGEGFMWLYVLSRPAPDFAHIVEQAGWPTTTEGWVTRPYEPLLERLAVGQRWGFRLTANPVKADATKGKGRFGHVTVRQQEQWLMDRATGWGFAVPERDGARDLVVHDRTVDQFRHGKSLVTLAKATYDGTLTIVDAEALRRVMINGAGHGKAYGCGLLTLAPLPG